MLVPHFHRGIGQYRRSLIKWELKSKLLWRFPTVLTLLRWSTLVVFCFDKELLPNSTSFYQRIQHQLHLGIICRAPALTGVSPYITKHTKGELLHYLTWPYCRQLVSLLIHFLFFIKRKLQLPQYQQQQWVSLINSTSLIYEDPTQLIQSVYNWCALNSIRRNFFS